MPSRLTGRAARSCLVALMALVASGCGQDEPDPPPYPTDPAGQVFDPDRVIEVEIEMAESDWETMRHQSRTWWDLVAASDRHCLDQPIGSPFPYFPGSVTVDGVRRDNVGLRKKGLLGSLDPDRPAFKVRFDRYVHGQSLHGLKRLTLNNSLQDPSYVKQCLAYELFGSVGVRVPRCNLAHVWLNGRDLGLYVNVESMDKDFLRRNFEDEGGDLWEGTLSDFRPAWINSWELKTNEPEDGDQTKVNRRRLLDFAVAIGEGVPDASLRQHVEDYTDLDDFLTFWAMEVLLVHWDGYTNNVNNTFVYDDPKTGKLVFMPWGTDWVFVQDPYADPPPPPSVYANGWLARRLYLNPETRDLYYSRLRELLETAWHEDQLLAEVDRMEGLALPVLQAAGADLEEHATTLAIVRDFIRTRRAILAADMAQGPPVWDRPPKPLVCVDLAGEVHGSLFTRFGTEGEVGPLYVGGGALQGTYRGRSFDTWPVGATAGWNPNDPTSTWPVMVVTGVGGDGNWYQVWLSIRPDKFKAGKDARFELGEARGSAGFWNPRARTWTTMGGLVQGKVSIEAAGTTADAHVSASFQAEMVQW